MVCCDSWLWGVFGRVQADLIHLGAKYSPCMRHDEHVMNAILDDRQKEKETGCCVRNDGSGCVQTQQADCSVCSTLHDFKLAVLVHKALHSQLPQYLAEDCQLLTDIGRRSLRSADVLTCATIRTRTRLGDRSFFVTGPCLWNSLSVTLRDRDISLAQFKRHLKTLWFV